MYKTDRPSLQSQQLSVNETVKSQLRNQLLVLRAATNRTQEEQATIFGVSLSTYKRWEKSGPDVFDWDCWERLLHEVEARVNKEHRQAYIDMFRKFQEAAGYLRKFLNMFKQGS
ncbi:hypothetical protein GCM10009092_29550 [Bowmanella denitrificans]|uniref:Antitoxin Xre-like helix-turn-helix domain-containing protein n=1 Tax=Bowmanella denitrificans TaxID=366582 RepID=A0ABN0XG48_9ALTE|nr:antitoxin Xre-like helix-turn-helix domain-containing protein [Bowmanella denitrificans]